LLSPLPKAFVQLDTQTRVSLYGIDDDALPVLAEVVAWEANGEGNPPRKVRTRRFVVDLTRTRER
jgi:hypothetical protein